MYLVILNISASVIMCPIDLSLFLLVKNSDNLLSSDSLAVEYLWLLQKLPWDP